MIQTISRMAANSFLPNHNPHQYHSSPGRLEVTTRSFTSPQAPYITEEYHTSHDSHRHTAPLNSNAPRSGSFPQHVGVYRDDRRNMERRPSGGQTQPMELQTGKTERNPRTREPEQKPIKEDYKQVKSRMDYGQMPSTEDYQTEHNRVTGDHRLAERGRHMQEYRHLGRRSSGEQCYSSPEVGSGDYRSMESVGPRSFEQPQSFPQSRSRKASDESYNKYLRTERSPPATTFSSLPSDFNQSSGPPSDSMYQPHSQSGFPPSSLPPTYQSHSQTGVLSSSHSSSSTLHQSHSQSNVTPYTHSSVPSTHSQTHIPLSTHSQSSVPVTTGSYPHRQPGVTMPTSSASMSHENVHLLHNRKTVMSAQTRSCSENSLDIPSASGVPQKHPFRGSRSHMDIPTPGKPLSPLIHSSEPRPSFHHPVHQDPLTTEGSSSAQRPFDSGSSNSPQHMPTVPDSQTTDTKHPLPGDQAPQTSSGPPRSSGHPESPPDPSKLHGAGSPQRKKSSRSKHFLSKATLENERYSLDGISRPDHDNEDRDFFREESDYTVFGVFDGHDGSRASGFASSYMRSLFDMPFWSSIMNQASDKIMREAMNEFFRDTEKEFFRSIQSHIDEKNRLQRIIPQHLSSYAAYQQFPYEVSRLQDLEPKLTGGCTAVLAILIKDKLYVANAGDSRAVLVREQANGTLIAEQLTRDHSVESEDELKRLEALGLDPRELIKAGRLGMHENTRSIGDYSIKEGYKEVDILRSANSPPGIATPYIMPARTIDHTCKYLILMTDGVYKSIESTFQDKESIDANKVLLKMLDRHISSHGGVFDVTSADGVLGRVAKIHRDCFTNNSRINPRSDLAVACRKRDDMTLLVYKFPDSD